MKRSIALITALLVSAVSFAAPVFGANAVAHDIEGITFFCQNSPGTYEETAGGESFKCLLDFDDMMFQEKPYKNGHYWTKDVYLPEQFEVSHMTYNPDTSRTVYYNSGRGYTYSRYAKLSFTVPSESVDKVNEYIKSDKALGKNFVNTICHSWMSDDSSSFTYNIEFHMNDTYDQARKIKQEVQEISDVEQFKFTPVINEIMPLFVFMLTYCPELPDSSGYGIKGVTLDEIKETLENYVDENDLDYNVELFIGHKGLVTESETGEYYGYQLVPNGEVPFADQAKLCKQIYDDLGYNTWYALDGRESSSGGIYGSDSIDMSNNVNGDANCDGEYTIADSTAILQALGNPDKYGLSLQGEFNADICNVGDGVTPSDALEVQKAMASKG